MKIKPFKAYLPASDQVSKVASRPYDVLDSDEARLEAKGNPLSFLHVVKPEITLPPETDHYDPAVYQAGKRYFEQMVADKVFAQENTPCLFIYELTMNGRSQNGIVGLAAVTDYMEGRIKKHELTRPDKETDRKNHVRISGMNAEPVFFAYKSDAVLKSLVNQIKEAPALFDFVADDQIRHRVWKLNTESEISEITDRFAQMPATYVADGHHRTAAAALVGDEMRTENPSHDGSEDYNYFLAVHFPDDELEIIDYNRVVKDLNNLSVPTFLQSLRTSFEVTKKGSTIYKPQKLHELSMYLDGNWYQLETKMDSIDDMDPIQALDVTVLSNCILKPILNIHDLRTDERIEFVGGIRGLEELQRRVDSGEMEVAFALYPVSMQQLMDIADNDLIMPPKVTWFEPKLRSGLFVYRFETL